MQCYDLVAEVFVLCCLLLGFANSRRIISLNNNPVIDHNGWRGSRIKEESSNADEKLYGPRRTAPAALHRPRGQGYPRTGAVRMNLR